MFSRWGFTTVFDLASVLENTLALRNRIETGEVRGPRILTVGEPVLTEIPVYVREYLLANYIQLPVVSTPQDAVQLVRHNAQQGASGIKLFTGSLQAGGKVANMPLDMAKAAVEEAHHHNLAVFTHPQNSEGVEVAIASGVDVLAHTVPQSPRWTPEFVARLKRAHMALIPTLTLFDFEARKADLSDQDREHWTDGMVAELRVFSQNGGQVLFGTDVGYTDHFDTTMEFSLMSQAGMSFRQILASLSTNPASRFAHSGDTGRIEPGTTADVTVMQDDPAKDITALARIQLTIRNGTIIYSSN
jgi:imidazolonepropionase-like amidohydrolase